jgi:hypothetical protein
MKHPRGEPLAPEPDLREHRRLITRALVQSTARCIERMAGHIDRTAVHLDRIDAQLDRIEARMVSIDHAMSKCADAFRAYTNGALNKLLARPRLAWLVSLSDIAVQGRRACLLL